MRVGQDYLPGLVRKCVDQKADVFGGFYLPFLSDCARQLGRWEMLGVKEFASHIDVRGVAGPLLRSVMDSFAMTGSRALIAAYRAGRGDPHRAPAGYQEFHEWVSTEPGREELLGHFPELARLLRLAAARCLEHAFDVLRAAWLDRQVLSDALGVHGPVTSLTPGLGDPHRRGKTVCLVGWENGAFAIYKPHRRGCQALLDALRGIADPDGSFFGPLFPRTVARPAHLWQERVAPADIDDAAGLAKYFRTFGRVSALVSMLGASDLHYENVIAAAGGPVIVDTETLVSLPAVADSGDVDPLAKDIARSALQTLLYPVPFSGARLGVDLSAIGAVRRGESELLQTFTIADAGTDRIRFDQVPVTIEPGSSMATTGDVPADPRAWVDELTAGFAEARELLRGHREAIGQAVTESRDWTVRHLIRPTYVYGRFLEASTHPTYLRRADDRVALLDKLPPSRHRIRPESAAALREEDVRALVDLDVPYFEVDCDSRDLRCNGQTTVRDALASTPRKALLASVAAFFDRPSGRDLTYIRYALASAADDVWESRDPVARAAWPGPALTDPAGWHASLRELVVGGPGRPTLLVPQLEGENLRLAPVNSLLHEGGGLMLYLGQAGVGGGGVTGAAAAYARATAAELAPTTPLSVSPFTGTLSSLVTGLELQQQGSDPVSLPALDALAGKQFDVESLSVGDFDYLNGFGGYLVYLAEYAERGAPRLDNLEPRRLLRRLADLDGSPDRHDGELGLAHGRFGRIAAMSALARPGTVEDTAVRAHLDRFASAYLHHRWTDEALRDEASRSGWCKGYAGVAYALTKLLRAVGYAPGEIRDLITPEVERVLTGFMGPDLSFCHGVAGRLAILCWLADRLHWPELRSQAQVLSSTFIERYGDGGWSCGVGTLPDLPSFLFGLSGWYYVQLMLAAPSLELPQCLGGR